jgi:hypothetical protein
MGEPLITTELENAILLMHYSPTSEWSERSPRRAPDVVAEEKELTNRHAERVLEVLYDVNREFIHIELGLI